MKPKICIVISNFYPKISKKLLSGANKELKKADFYSSNLIYVPGIFEIPIMIGKKINEFDAFIALGCVIKGKTPHFEFIADAVTNGIMNLSINYKKPIGYGIITCLNKKQALERSDHQKKNKGTEAAKAIIDFLAAI